MNTPIFAARSLHAIGVALAFVVATSLPVVPTGLATPASLAPSVASHGAAHMATSLFDLMVPPAAAHGAGRAYDLASIALARRLALPGELPPPRAGTEPLAFADFHVRPAGPAGLEFTPRLRALDGRRVRLVGYVAGQDTPSPGRLILAPMPVTLATRADGPADDLPPAHVYVQLPPAYARHDLPPLPVPVVLEGRLELGARDEAHGRVSWVRLELDPDDPRLPRPDPEKPR